MARYVAPHRRGASHPSACRCASQPSLFPFSPHICPSRASLPLLGSLAQFCAAFYHIEPTVEAGLEELCLAPTRCPRKSVACIARLQRRHASGSWEDAYVCRYHNCYQGSSEANVHAERFLCDDKVMQSAVESVRGGRLVLYLTYQPCHFSGGHSSQRMGGRTSCTKLLLEYSEKQLAPHQVALEIRVAYIYRAHWKEGCYSPKYKTAVDSAIEGLKLLSSHPGVSISALNDEDWKFLAHQCEEAVARGFDAAAAGDTTVRTVAKEEEVRLAFTPNVRKQRAALDRFIAASLQTICGRPGGNEGMGAADLEKVSGTAPAREDALSPPTTLVPSQSIECLERASITPAGCVDELEQSSGSTICEGGGVSIPYYGSSEPGGGLEGLAACDSLVTEALKTST
ncbi:MAG: hypothetical protein SGPRY_007680 [Prymnesium sp.]